MSGQGRTCYDHRASLRPVKPDSRREIQRANWHPVQRLANLGRSCRSVRIRADSKREIRDTEGTRSVLCSSVAEIHLPLVKERLPCREESIGGRS